MTHNQSELANKKPSRGVPRLGAALTIIADIRSVYPINTFSGTTQDELVEFITANYTPNSEVDQLKSRITWLEGKIEALSKGLSDMAYQRVLGKHLPRFEE